MASRTSGPPRGEAAPRATLLSLGAAQAAERLGHGRADLLVAVLEEGGSREASAGLERQARRQRGRRRRLRGASWRRWAASGGHDGHGGDGASALGQVPRRPSEPRAREASGPSGTSASARRCEQAEDLLVQRATGLAGAAGSWHAAPRTASPRREGPVRSTAASARAGRQAARPRAGAAGGASGRWGEGMGETPSDGSTDLGYRPEARVDSTHAPSVADSGR